MLKKDLDFQYPEHLIATERKAISRVMHVQAGVPTETTLQQILTEVSPNDLFVVNETRVIPARVYSEDGLEILFLKPSDQENVWEVLTPARRWPKSNQMILPMGIQATLLQRGLPQQILLNQPLPTDYFDRYGEMPVPPYIQQARAEKQARPSDAQAYQTDWAQVVGSLAAPTASLHFKNQDLEKLKARGAQVAQLCLHVGLGTFMPVHADSLADHKMHKEWVRVPQSTWQAVQECKARGGKVWCLGTTVTRALESLAHGYLSELDNGDWVGETDLFILPGFEYRVTDVLLTNFHQPQSTLLALVMAFAGEDVVKRCYGWAIEHQYRLFSYGDLSVWKK